MKNFSKSAKIMFDILEEDSYLNPSEKEVLRVDTIRVIENIFRNMNSIEKSSISKNIKIDILTNLRDQSFYSIHLILKNKEFSVFDNDLGAIVFSKMYTYLVATIDTKYKRLVNAITSEKGILKERKDLRTL